MDDNVMLRLARLREMRISREKARLDKLREMNIKKYSRDDSETKKLPASSGAGTKRPSSIPLSKRLPSGSSQSKTNAQIKLPKSAQIVMKPKTQLDSLSKPANIPDILSEVNKKHMQAEKTIRTVNKTLSLVKQIEKRNHRADAKKIEASRKSVVPQAVSKVVTKKATAPLEVADKTEVKKLENRKTVPSEIVKSQRKTMVPSLTPAKVETKAPTRKTLAPIDMASRNTTRKSLMPIALPKTDVAKSKSNTAHTRTTSQTKIPPKVTQSASKVQGTRESVFDRLYKPRPVNDKIILNNAQRLRTDTKYCSKVVRDSNLIVNKRHTVFEPKKQQTVPVRRSISAVHFKRIPRSELVNCITKWSSRSTENLSKTPLKEINEDELVQHQERLISAVKSERKKVTFQRQSINNGPTPAELQARLKNWLQKRGKSLDSYHHLQCFGLHHLVQSEREIRPYDDENKENVSVTSDSDDGSYSDAMNGKLEDGEKTKDASCEVDNKWRHASLRVEFDDTPVSIQSQEEGHDTAELVNGALADLTDILREGYPWEQSARWLRAIRERFPSATERAAYWECRAALEEAQGHLPASVQCWEEAIAKGTERKVVEANLDQLLDKFMRLNISPRSEGARREAHDKMVDVRNVFKSTIIRFAVQQAKLRQSGQHDPASAYTVTPVRRSTRLSHVATPRSRARTPLVQICKSLRHADEAIGGKARFVPNTTIPDSP